jgi:hypothetical protein
MTAEARLTLAENLRQFLDVELRLGKQQQQAEPRRLARGPEHIHQCRRRNSESHATPVCDINISLYPFECSESQAVSVRRSGNKRLVNHSCVSVNDSLELQDCA